MLAIAILAFVVFAIIMLFKIYFNKISQANLSSIHKDDRDIEILNSRVKYSEVNAFAWTKPIFLMGLAASICFTLFAFSWTTEYQNEVYSIVIEPILPDEVNIVRTQHSSPQPPPPPPPPIIEIPVEVIPEDLISELIDETIEPEEAIEEPVEENGTDKGIGEPSPPPPPPIPIIDSGVDAPPILMAEQMPRFPGCEELEGTRKEKKKCAEKKLLDYIYDNLKYPALAIQNGIEGKSTLRFVVNKEGRIDDIQILQEPGGGCGAAAAKVIESMNNMPEKWTPGKQRGVPVKVLYTIPIHFKLN